MSTIVIMPGGFHPFHAGHAALYDSARKAFPNAEVFVAATNDTSTRPFPFAIKEKLAKLAGVEPGHFVQVKSPFRAEEITAQFDPKKDRLIFVRSEKDAAKPPQAGGVKKDGSLAYLQPLAGQTNIRPFGEHAYMAYLPTVEFGPGMTSATEIRTAWPTLNEKRKTALVMSLYPKTQTNPKLAANVVKMLDTAIGSDLTESGMLGHVMFRSKPPKLKKIQPAASRTKDFMKKDFTLKEFAPGGNSASSYYAVTSNFVDEFTQQKQEELQDLIDSGWTKQDLAQAGTLQGQAADIAHFEQVRDGFLKGLKPGFDAYLQGDTQLKDQLGSYWIENDLPLNQDWQKIYGEPWGRDEYDEDVADGLNEFVGNAKDFGGKPNIKVRYQNGQDFVVSVNGDQYSFAVTNMEAQGENPVLFNIANHIMMDINGDQPPRDIQQAVANYIDEYHQRDLAKVSAFHDKKYAQHPDYYHTTYQKPLQRVSDFVKKDPDQDMAENQGWAATFTNEETGQMAGTPASTGMWAGYQRRENQPIDEKKKKTFRDTELIKTRQFAQSHYPTYDPDTAVEKWIQRSLKHSEQEDAQQDKILARLAAKVDMLNKKLNSLQKSDYIEEKWSQKYKNSINCANPKGFSQRAHCAGRKK